MNELETKLARFFDRTLDGAEAQALARDLERNPEGVREFIGNYRVDRLLAAKFQPSGAEAIDAIMEQVRREEHPFVQSVLRDIRALPSRTTLAQHVREWIARWRYALHWTLAATAVVVMALAGIWFFGPTTGEPVVGEATAGGVILEHAGQTLLAPVGARLQAADALRTGTNAVAIIAFGAEHTRLELRELSEFKLTSLSRGKRFELKAGKIEASVARQRPFRPMILTTPQAEARVVGTKFSLWTTTNFTRLEVTEGRVSFSRASDGLAVKVPAGNYAVAASNYGLAAQPLTGSILREYWTNIFGTGNLGVLMRSPDYPNHPSGRSYLKTFEAPSHWGQNYGARIAGYLHPPVTAEYTFWIEASDLCELFLSPNEDPENRRQIAYAEATSPREWTKNLAQQSSAITLIAGRRYYIEVLQKQGQGDDHLAVAWQGPGRDREIIPGEFLSPFEPKKEKARKP